MVGLLPWLSACWQALRARQDGMLSEPLKSGSPGTAVFLPFLLFSLTHFHSPLKMGTPYLEYLSGTSKVCVMSGVLPHFCKGECAEEQLVSVGSVRAEQIFTNQVLN